MTGGFVVAAWRVLGWRLYISPHQVASLSHKHRHRLRVRACIAKFSISAVGLVRAIFHPDIACFALISVGEQSPGRGPMAGALRGSAGRRFARATCPGVFRDYPYKYANQPSIDLLRGPAFEHRVSVEPLQSGDQQILPLPNHLSAWNGYKIVPYYQYYSVPRSRAGPREAADTNAFRKAILGPATSHLGAALAAHQTALTGWGRWGGVDALNQLRYWCSGVPVQQAVYGGSQQAQPTQPGIFTRARPQWAPA